MTKPIPILIKTDLFNSGCLPVLLRREIKSVEEMVPRHQDYYTYLYLNQLKAVLAAVEAAREPRS